MRRIRWIAPLIGAGMLWAGPAVAADFTFHNICGFGDNTGLKVCASADVTMAGNDLVMRVWNMETVNDHDHEFGVAHTITSIALKYFHGANPNDFYSPGASGMAASYYAGAGDVDPAADSYWKQGASSIQVSVDDAGGETNQGHKGGIVGCTDPGPESANHYSTCGGFPSYAFMQFTFFDVTFQEGTTLADYGFAFHTQQIDDEDSAKAFGPPTTTVPEPMTMLLLGSGLFGIGGVAMRRRRQEFDLQTEDTKV